MVAGSRTSAPPAPLSVPQAAAILGIPPRAVYKLCRAQQIPHYRMGLKKKTIRIDVAAVEAYKESCFISEGLPVEPAARVRRRGRNGADAGFKYLKGWLPSAEPS